MQFVSRVALYLAAISLIGSAIFPLLVIRRAPVTADRRAAFVKMAARCGFLAAAALLPIAAARIYFQLDALRFPGEPLLQSLSPLLTETLWGKAWIAQVAVAAVCVASFARQRANAASLTPSAFAAVCAVLLALSMSFSGHPAGATTYRELAIASDALHVMGAGSWIGTLAVLGLAVAGAGIVRAPDAERPTESYALVRAFSPVALTCSSLVVASGTISAVLRLNSPADLLTATYGRLLAAKLCVALLVIVLGYLNWKKNTPAIPSDGGALLRRGVLRELTAAAVVLLATAALVVAPPPSE